MELAYTPVAREPARDPDHAWRVGQLLGSTGNLNAAVHICAKLCFLLPGTRRQYPSSRRLEQSWDPLAKTRHVERRDWDVQGFSRSLHHAPGTCTDLHSRYQIRRRSCWPKGISMELWTSSKKAAELFVASGDRRGAHEPLGNQASILRKAGDLAETMAIYKEKKRLKSKEKWEIWTGCRTPFAARAWYLMPR